MKKTLGLIFAGIAACSLSAAELDIDGKFTKLTKDGSKPAAWVLNQSTLPDIGVINIEKGREEGTHGLMISASSRATAVYTAPSFPVKPYDKITVSADVKGSGTAYFYIYVYSAEGRYIYATRFGDRKVTENFSRMEGFAALGRSYPATVNGEKVRLVPAKLKVAVMADKNSDVVFENVKAVITEKK